MTHINSIEAFINPRVITFIDCGMALKKYTSEKKYIYIQVRCKGLPKSSAECLNQFHFVLITHHNIQLLYITF